MGQPAQQHAPHYAPKLPVLPIPVRSCIFREQKQHGSGAPHLGSAGGDHAGEGLHSCRVFSLPCILTHSCCNWVWSSRARPKLLFFGMLACAHTPPPSHCHTRAGLLPFFALRTCAVRRCEVTTAHRPSLISDVTPCPSDCPQDGDRSVILEWEKRYVTNQGALPNLELSQVVQAVSQFQVACPACASLFGPPLSPTLKLIGCKTKQYSRNYGPHTLPLRQAERWD